MPERSVAIRDIVTIGHSDEARALEVAGEEGVVLGISADEATGEPWFAVQVSDLPTVMLPPSDLTPTGRSVARGELYSGESLRVTRHGRVFDDAPPDDEVTP